nr:MAG TPA: hypothetical protein [Caudoviricetes sp.]
MPRTSCYGFGRIAQSALQVGHLRLRAVPAVRFASKASPFSKRISRPK